jgi:hypothetical protein
MRFENELNNKMQKCCFKNFFQSNEILFLNPYSGLIRLTGSREFDFPKSNILDVGVGKLRLPTTAFP